MKISRLFSILILMCNFYIIVMKALNLIFLEALEIYKAMKNNDKNCTHEQINLTDCLKIVNCHFYNNNCLNTHFIYKLLKKCLAVSPNFISAN